MTALTVVSSNKCHGGYQWIYSHKSSELNCEMKFSLFMPPSMEGEKFPVLFYLSGLTCNEKNFIEKSGFQTYAAKHKIIVVAPDTSPRDCNIDGEDVSWDFGTGAGFYVDATEEKWKKHYRMYSYVTEELPSLIHKEFSTNGLMSIMGHSMGGHGALIGALKNPGKYKSVSAFSPICNPMKCPWGEKCFTGYLGNDTKSWENYDATCLVKNYNGPAIEVLIDQGSEDQFLHNGQLLPDNFSSACQGIENVALQLRKQQGYDHSYYFISSFTEDHIAFHSKHLNK